MIIAELQKQRLLLMYNKLSKLITLMRAMLIKVILILNNKPQNKKKRTIKN